MLSPFRRQLCRGDVRLCTYFLSDVFYQQRRLAHEPRRAAPERVESARIESQSRWQSQREACTRLERMASARRESARDCNDVLSLKRTRTDRLFETD